MGPFPLVFADPPYGQGLAERALASAAAGDWLAVGALVAVEEAESARFVAPAGFRLLDRLHSGVAAVHLLRYRSEDEAIGTIPFSRPDSRHL